MVRVHVFMLLAETRNRRTMHYVERRQRQQEVVKTAWSPFTPLLLLVTLANFPLAAVFNYPYNFSRSKHTVRNTDRLSHSNTRVIIG